MNAVDEKFFKDRGYVETSPGVWERPRPLAIDAALPANQRVKVNAAPVRKAVGRRHETGMNKTESTYALRLEAMKRAGEIYDYRFEPFNLRLAPKTFYKVDFLVINWNLQLEMHEVKTMWGIRVGMEDDAYVKLKVVAEMYPWFIFRLAVHKKGEWTITEI